MIFNILIVIIFVTWPLSAPGSIPYPCHTYIAYFRQAVTVKSCLKAVAFSTFRAGYYTRHAYIHDRLICNSCAIISSIHSAEHACRTLTSVCSIHDFPYNKLYKKSLLRATATIRERLMCRYAVAKVCGFYSRAAHV